MSSADRARAAKRPGAGRLALLVGVLLVVSGCSVREAGAPGTSPTQASSNEPEPSASPARSRPVASSPGPPPASAADASAAVMAARDLLGLSGARFELAVDRHRPDLPTLRDVQASGVMDPAGDRGSMTWTLYPNDGAAPSPDLSMTFEVRWTATDFWARDPSTSTERWTRADRDEAPERAMIGRVNEEPLALVRFVAAAASGDLDALPAAAHEAETAVRWLVHVPAAEAAAAYVPPDTYLAFEATFGIDALPLEVWLVDGRIVRVGYVLEREQAPYGGPDRIETWYDWSAFGEPFDVALPPAGQIVELEVG